MKILIIVAIIVFSVSLYRLFTIIAEEKEEEWEVIRKEKEERRLAKEQDKKRLEEVKLKAKEESRRKREEEELKREEIRRLEEEKKKELIREAERLKQEKLAQEKRERTVEEERISGYIKSQSFKSFILKMQKEAAVFNNRFEFFYKLEKECREIYGANDKIRNIQGVRNAGLSYVYWCSKGICIKAKEEPVKYICKYFNIYMDKNTLKSLERLQENLHEMERIMNYLPQERERIANKVKKEIPIIVRIRYMDSIWKFVGARELDKNMKLPIADFHFKYQSPQGRTNHTEKFILDHQLISEIIAYMKDDITYKETMQYQRSLMTPALRKKIMKNDNYTCRYCGVSKKDHPSIQLEVDHIIPVSKGGLTEEDNLQTLCLRCNRGKGAKIYAT